ncbi:unnamed protein product [Scomber scombrus]|uniref:Unnamed protein product n=1 Tax=Scomber scombrus TaxID=13677 RepID=A0AAV1P8C3_SCOSC
MGEVNPCQLYKALCALSPCHSSLLSYTAAHLPFTSQLIHSLINSLTKDELEKLKETVHRTQQNIDKRKADHKSSKASFEESMNEDMNIIEEMIASLKKFTMEISVDFPQPDGILESYKAIADKLMTHKERQDKDVDAIIEKDDKENRKRKENIESLEEKQAEL